ncbi:hypothetical protein METBIDRAFT_67006 [Metschnikowia bicuspidata var. bicuspidata NRRL YB-4993]|uniref:Pru domain-containing protein n=1 Tax=Metschnikowia bicuspidata var. bicuspidata NRRL YB-4993 TaxID=869754 RepID=A0A1A0HCT2_9ASCO|nr:hypothetical protein METBIDRAFT_67006 [Metschnikowia bicuspidata var. bicuspidata NRRL YB-4993]OBA21909.1 hypothetical protein METBIDRAFT_67006 [Metschnikowia bicuspidata var. bicuspidata NRRL YB-4993]
MTKTIRFNAGKVQYDDETKRCTPLPHRGVVTIAPSDEDEGFFDFCWAPKADSGLEKDELLLIPGDMTFRRVQSCKTGRVVALTFLSSGDKSLYWLQDVGDDEQLDRWTQKDEALVSAVQALITPADDGDDEAAADAAAVKEEPVPPRSTAADFFPVLLLSDVLSDELVLKHLRSMLPDELRARYGDMLPDAVEPSAEQIMAVVRSEFFRNSSAELSMNMTENNIGLILATSFGYEYSGEGIDAFLKGLRDSAKKSREDS